MRMIALALLLAAACNKNSPPASPTAPPAVPQATVPTPTPAAAPADDVRPPRAEDLATYTADLKGDGPLQATVETSQGTINCTLFDKGAPITVANFVGLARGLKPFVDPRTNQVSKRPFYDGLIFHRVIPEFMIQGGDPTGTGRGNPGYQFVTEVSPSLRHDKPGVLAMANAGPNTNGSQFYITEEPQPRLDGGYNVFGQCKDVDVVKKIARVPRSAGDRPNTPVTITKVTIHR